ncbi:MAG TPA: asparagine--tRNA ligase [Candidatus Saccharimonadales bacterium]|nr:asparagine--tRNA ligase [Candidatus Saccharimonadales bacterium]
MRLPVHDYLDSLGVPYQTASFPTSTEKGAAGVANAFPGRVTLRQVIKSLMFETGTKEIVLVLVGGDQNVISGQLKKIAGDRNIKMAPGERIREISGYEIGSIPPFSWQPQGFRTFIDAALLSEPILAVGTGTWGEEIFITPDNLVKASSARAVNLTNAEAPATPAANPAVTVAVTAPASNVASLSVPVPVAEPQFKVSDACDISDLPRHIGETRCVRGWLYNKRSSGGMVFLQLRDGTGFIQGVLEKSSVTEETWEAAQQLTRESSCMVRGVVREEPRAPSGIEMSVKDVIVVHISQEYPIGKKEHGPEFLFDWRHLNVRSQHPWAVLRIRDEVFFRLTEFFRNQGYARVDTPVLQPTHCEDSTQLFEVDYFGSPMYLTQSGQLYLETLLHGLGKVYDFGPVFRAERSKTRKHLCEFWMLDWETPFTDQGDAENFLEKMIKYVLSAVLEHRRPELKILERDTAALEKARDNPFVRIELGDAIAILNGQYQMGLASDEDLSADAEERLATHFGLPVFVKNYPYAVKAFYMKHFPAADGVERAICADLLAPEGAGEIATCAVRESDHARLVHNLHERGQSEEEYSWYLDVRRYGSVPHSGGGIGPERIIRWFTGVHHIRETIPFPRTLVRSTP